MNKKQKFSKMNLFREYHSLQNFTINIEHTSIRQSRLYITNWQASLKFRQDVFH